MKSVPFPKLVASSVFTKCVDAKRNGVEKNNLRAVASIVTKASKQYVLKGKKGLLYTLPRQSKIGIIKGKVMENLYTNNLVSNKSKARHLYNELRHSIKHNRCPYCSHRDVSTLDHYLPKAVFPVYAVTPANLVPSCKDCNDCKRTTISKMSDEQFIHPYFDDPDFDVWLVAELTTGNKPSVSYSVKPGTRFSTTVAERICYHFSKLKLNSLYSAQAAVEITAIRLQLERLSDSGGEPEVTNYLAEQFESRSVLGKNNWQTALYLTLSQSHWFCDGGFKLFS